MQLTITGKPVRKTCIHKDDMKHTRYDEFIDKYYTNHVNTGLSKKLILENGQKMWNQIKKDFNHVDAYIKGGNSLERKVSMKIQSLDLSKYAKPGIKMGQNDKDQGQTGGQTYTPGTARDSGQSTQPPNRSGVRLLSGKEKQVKVSHKQKSVISNFLSKMGLSYDVIFTEDVLEVDCFMSVVYKLASTYQLL